MESNLEARRTGRSTKTILKCIESFLVGNSTILIVATSQHAQIATDVITDTFAALHLLHSNFLEKRGNEFRTFNKGNTLKIVTMQYLKYKNDTMRGIAKEDMPVEFIDHFVKEILQWNR
jgi:hypothetical protein